MLLILLLLIPLIGMFMIYTILYGRKGKGNWLSSLIQIKYTMLLAFTLNLFVLDRYNRPLFYIYPPKPSTESRLKNVLVAFTSLLVLYICSLVFIYYFVDLYSLCVYTGLDKDLIPNMLPGTPHLSLSNKQTNDFWLSFTNSAQTLIPSLGDNQTISYYQIITQQEHFYASPRPLDVLSNFARLKGIENFNPHDSAIGKVRGVVTDMPTLSTLKR